MEGRCCTFAASLPRGGENDRQQIRMKVSLERIK